MVWTLLIIFLFWIITLPSVLIIISEKLSLVGLYHNLKSSSNPGGETGFEKITKIVKCDFYLSLPFIATFMLILENVLHVWGKDILILSFLLTLSTLLVLRILLNPSELFQTHIDRLLGIYKRNDIVCFYKERIISFFYSFIGVTLIILMVILSYHVLIDLRIGKTFMSLDNIGYKESLGFFLIYMLSLVICASIGELILYFFPPSERS